MESDPFEEKDRKREQKKEEQLTAIALITTILAVAAFLLILSIEPSGRRLPPPNIPRLNYPNSPANQTSTNNLFFNTNGK